ncbi:MAG: hypothetical protein H6598_04040 [Flavobacteriales bacterium]|nr:hypothetical protein [Flavobacteriales bacterium]
MATKTGVVKSIAANRTSAEIIQDADGSIIETTDVLSSLVVEDGVSYIDNNGKADNLKEITKVSIKGDLTLEEQRSLSLLVATVNGRGGGGGIQISIKTKM